MKSALVTGASGSIGRAISIQLAAQLKYHVIVHYHVNLEGAKQTLKEIEASGGTGELIQFDAGNNELVVSAIENWYSNNPEGTIEVVVNNAGIVNDGLFVFMNEGAWDSVVDIKLKGFYNVTRSVVQKMTMKRYGRIINISSVNGIYGSAGQVNYAAANGALIAATKSLSKELGKRNITVNAVAPGFIESEMTQGLNIAQVLPVIPLNRLGKPDEVAELVCFLASNKAAYINGECIAISGGI